MVALNFTVDPSWPSSVSLGADGLSVTARDPWSFAALIPLPTPIRAGHVEVQLRVPKGRIGLAVLGRSSTDVVSEAWLHGSEPQSVRLNIGEREITKGLIVRNGDAAESRAVIMSVRMIVDETSPFRRNEPLPEPQAPSALPLHHYSSVFDAEETMRRHARHSAPHPHYMTNFLGVRIDPKFFPDILTNHAGHVEPIPIPANWHADVAEWAAALRAVDLSPKTFTVIELGCGWGCWLNNAGVAARNLGKTPHLIGVEADRGHLEFAKEACRANGFLASQVALHHGVAAASDGVARFPNQTTPGLHWGNEPLRGNETADYSSVPQISLHSLIDRRVDLLHLDIQGGEAGLIEATQSILNEAVAYVVVGTHSRQIEGRIFDSMARGQWKLEIERPATLDLSGPSVSIDGVQGWRNLALLPEDRP